MCSRVPMSRFSSFGPRISATVPVAWRRHSSNWNKPVARRGIALGEEQVALVLRVDMVDPPAVAEHLDRLTQSGRRPSVVTGGAAPIDPEAAATHTARASIFRMAGMLARRYNPTLPISTEYLRMRFRLGSTLVAVMLAGTGSQTSPVAAAGGPAAAEEEPVPEARRGLARRRVLRRAARVRLAAGCSRSTTRSRSR